VLSIGAAWRGVLRVSNLDEVGAFARIAARNRGVVHLAVRSPRGCGWIEVELYLPSSSTIARRSRAAGSATGLGSRRDDDW
jgi:hypothetical protein